MSRQLSIQYTIVSSVFFSDPVIMFHRSGTNSIHNKNKTYFFLTVGKKVNDMMHTIVEYNAILLKLRVIVVESDLCS